MKPLTIANSATIVLGLQDEIRRSEESRYDQHAHDFALDFLPQYSPELNPIELVWKLTRRRCLHNRYFENLQDVISAVESEFATWTTRNDDGTYEIDPELPEPNLRKFWRESCDVTESSIVTMRLDELP